MKRFLKDYGLSVALAALFLVAWAAQFGTQIAVVANEAMQHGQSFSWSEFWPQFGQSTFENWQSEFLQLLTMAVLTSFLIHKGSAESKDSDDEIKAMLARIEQRLDAVDTRGAGSKS